MMGSFRRRGCKCKKKRCTCGSKWTFRYHIIDPKTGKRKQKETRGFDTKEDAEAEAKRILAEIEKGVFVDEKNVTFGEFVPEFLKFYKNSGKKPGSVRVRTSRSKLLLKHFDRIKMKDITKLMYQDYLVKLKNEGYQKETIVSTHATAKLIFHRALEFELIKMNPAKGAIIPQDIVTVEELESETKIPPFMEKDELKLFLKTAIDHGLDYRDYPMFLTLAYTGMRDGELCVLKWSDIDFVNKTISITKTMDNEKNNTKEYNIVPPKTKSSIRVIEISDTVISVLNSHKKNQNIVKMENRDVWHDGNFVFTKGGGRSTYFGYPFMQKDIGARMLRLLKIAGLNTELTPHSLRHTHTSLLAATKKVSLETIQERLGHKDDDTTRLIYLHITKDLKREASQEFDGIMGSLQ